MWDAQSGERLWTGHLLPESQTAALDYKGNRIRYASPEAWRWLSWRYTVPETGELRLLPAAALRPAARRRADCIIPARRSMLLPVTIALLLLLASPAEAALVRMQVTHRSDVLDGKAFRAGPYERLSGRAWFAVDPASPANTGIYDIQHAPKNARNQVEFSADFYILRPQTPARGNQTLLFEVSNRGGKGALGMLQGAASAADPRTPEHFGDEMLLREGYTIAWAGWQHDVAPRPHALRLYAPKAAGITGLVRAEFIPNAPTRRMPLADSGHVPYEIADPASLTVTVRASAGEPRRPVPAAQYKIAGTALQFDVNLEPGRIYEAVYLSRDPAVAMLGLAAIRDFVSYLRGRDHILHTIGFGISQSAMLLRAFLYHGFNEDERGKRVFDGVLVHVAGGRRSTLHRFSQPSRTAAPLRAVDYGTDSFPFSDATQKDPETGIADGILARTKPAATPKIFYTNSAYEYWGSSASLLHTTPDGKADMAPPRNTRIYMFSGGQHGPARFPPQRREDRNLESPVDYRWSVRALLRALRGWVVEGTQPPPSRYPRLRDKTLVPVAQVRAPGEIRFPHSSQVARRLDFGPQFRSHGIIEFEPPRAGKPFGVLVPQVDAVGNDIAGVRMPEVEVPLGVYTGWNFGTTANDRPVVLVNGAGSFFPRRDLAKHYKGPIDYLNLTQNVAAALADGGYLLPQDIPEIVKAAAVRWKWIVEAEPPQ